MNIPETTSTLGFATAVQFDRTGRLREKVTDCTREELIDLVFLQINQLEKAQGIAQHLSEGLEEHLGWVKGPGL